MKRPATWKVLTLGATMSALAGLGLVGAGTAIADTGAPQAGPTITATGGATEGLAQAKAGFAQQGCTKVGTSTTQCQTPGNTQIVSEPNPKTRFGGLYGPFFFQNRGWSLGVLL